MDPVIVVADKNYVPPLELSDHEVEMVHNGLLRPSEKAIFSMAREILKWRGIAEPDAC